MPETAEILTACNNIIQIYENRKRVRTLNSLAVRLRQSMVRHFENRQRFVLGRLQALWPIKTEAISPLSYDAQWITMHIYDRDEEQLLIVKILNPYYMEAGTAGTAAAIQALQNIIQREVIYRGSMHWIQNNAIKFGTKYADYITQTTNEAIRNEISEAIKLGENLDEVMQRIKDVYSEAAGYRSEMIGRTEMGRAYNSGALEQDKALGIEQWEWSGCDPACDICAPFLNGNPYDYDGIQNIIATTHPNCLGSESANVPQDFEPNELAA